MLAFEDVSYVFVGGAGVTDLRFEVAAGEIVALVGLNGAGKTTLMRLALGMLRPQVGTVRVLGQPLEALPSGQWSRVGALVETPAAYPELTVRENLRIACLLRGADSSNVEKSLEAWGFGSLDTRRFRRLSSGNRQRVGLAAALQHDPGLILLDEPGNALDPASVILLREQLTRRAGDDTAILVSSHHLDEVARIADRVLLMNRGRLIGRLDNSETDLERTFFEQIRADDEERESSGKAGE